jgi:BTB/POZ domain
MSSTVVSGAERVAAATELDARSSGGAAQDDSINAASLCGHLCTLGLSGAYSDVTVVAFGKQWPLHRVVLARSHYFRRLFEGDWSDSGNTTLPLTLDDSNATSAGLHTCLAWLYGQPLALDSSLVCSVLACAVFLSLDALGDACVAFITADLTDSTFHSYFYFCENANYGPLGDRVRSACWALLCRCASRELRHTLHSLPLGTLASLLTSSELFASTEMERFQLACDALARRWSSVKQWARPGTGPDADHDATVEAVFGPGGIIYSTFTFNDLTAARHTLEAAGAPVSILAAVSDGLWQQTVLRQQVMAAVAAYERVTPAEPGRTATGQSAESAESGASAAVTLRFGTEFAGDLTSLEDGQARHGNDVFWAGSWWKVSAQVFASAPATGTATAPLDGAAPPATTSRAAGVNSAGRAQLGLFLHRRRADETALGTVLWADPVVSSASAGHVYCDSRDRVRARYQIILSGIGPHSLLVLGTLAPENPAILLPKAPKGWGWRSVGALDDVARHPLRVSVAVQLDLAQGESSASAGPSTSSAVQPAEGV